MIDHIDPVNRLIFLDSSTVNANVDPIDIYKEMRTMRRMDISLRPYNIFLKAYGNRPAGSEMTSNGIIAIEGTKIVPYDGTYFINITGEMISDNGLVGESLFDMSMLTNGNVVTINYLPACDGVTIDDDYSHIIINDKLNTIISKLDNVASDIEENTDVVTSSKGIKFRVIS